MTRLRRSIGPALRGGIFFALLTGTWATAADTPGTTTINSPASGSTITFQGSQPTFLVKYNHDWAWAYFGYVVNRVNADGTVTPFSSASEA